MEDDASGPRCGACLDAVCKDAKLLADGAWRIGEDARYHWARDIGEVTTAGGGFPRERAALVLAVCGLRALGRQALR